MKKIFIFLLFIAAFSAHSQTVVLKVDRKSEQRVSDRGPNLKRFSHFFIRGGVLASEDKPGARIIYGPSVNLAFGVRVKYKISNVYSLGYEIENEFTDYKFKQEKGKTIPDTIINEMGRLDYSSLAAGLYNRINFDPSRGNFLGTFLDIGVKGELHYSIKYITKNELPDGTLEKTSIRHLSYINNANVNVYGRLGFSHFSLHASYRLLDLFKSSVSYSDLPRIVAGIDIAIF